MADQGRQAQAGRWGLSTCKYGKSSLLWVVMIGIYSNDISLPASHVWLMTHYGNRVQADGMYAVRDKGTLVDICDALKMALISTLITQFSSTYFRWQLERFKIWSLSSQIYHSSGISPGKLKKVSKFRKCIANCDNYRFRCNVEYWCSPSCAGGKDGSWGPLRRHSEGSLSPENCNKKLKI